MKNDFYADTNCSLESDAQFGFSDVDRIDGGEGIDTIDGQLGNDTLDGGEGDDVIVSMSGDHLVLRLTAGDDSRTVWNGFRDGSREWRVEGVEFADGRTGREKSRRWRDGAKAGTTVYACSIGQWRIAA